MLAEKAKIELSECRDVDIHISPLCVSNADRSAGTTGFEMKLSRSDFEDEITQIRGRSIDVVKSLLAQDGFDSSRCRYDCSGRRNIEHSEYLKKS